MSTEDEGAQAFDQTRRYELNPSVALRPEPFGALAYHFGNRKLSFLKEPKLVEVVRQLAAHETVTEMLVACSVPEQRRAHYLSALASLAATDMIKVR